MESTEEENTIEATVIHVQWHYMKLKLSILKGRSNEILNSRKKSYEKKHSESPIAEWINRTFRPHTIISVFLNSIWELTIIRLNIDRFLFTKTFFQETLEIQKAFWNFLVKKTKLYPYISIFKNVWYD